MGTKSYIPHIDGMRAISVVAVILFHFELLGFTGGYIGVDVFFTISGYLIIGSIVGQAEAGKFKASKFWGKRIRRLFPAIFATLFLSFLAGLVLMSPADLTKLARDSIFGLVSLINFTLLGETDYFDLQGFNEPLLHFWSLAVEEQFYLVFPLIALIVLALMRKERAPGAYQKTIVWTLLILSVLSLAAAEFAIRTGRPLIAYYMMPTRFFQLALGGVLAIWLQSPAFRERRDARARTVHDILVLGSIAIIIGLSLVFTKFTPFPGINAIWPTLAALALLYSGGLSRVSFLLENPVSAHLGKLSYSLYLVHWPVWTFMCYYFDRLLTLPETGVALGLTYVISWAIYRFVETPVRFSPVFEGRRLYAIVAPLAVASAVLFVATLQQGGWIQRIPDNQRAFAEDAANFHKEQFGGVGYASSSVNRIGHALAEPEFILFGDSKASQFAHGLDTLLKERNRAGLLFFQNGCAFIPQSGKVLDGQRVESCARSADNLRDLVISQDLPILTIRSWTYSQSPEYQIYRYNADGTNRPLTRDEFLDAHWTFLSDLAGDERPLTIIGDNGYFSGQTVVADCITRPTWLGRPCSEKFSIPVPKAKINAEELVLKDRAQAVRPIAYIDSTDIFCPDGTCETIASDGTILYSDAGHLSRDGALRAAPILLDKVGIAQSPGPMLGDVPELSDIVADMDRAARQGDMDALEAAVELFLKVSPSPRASFDLINGYWNGQGEEARDKDRRVARLIAERISARTDETLSTYVAGFSYWWGEGGVEKDPVKAVHYWTKPSQSSNQAVQFRLAEMYLDNDSPVYDPIAAQDRMKRSAALGYQPAIDWLAKSGTD